MSNQNAQFHPIIYVRGYAISKQEREETTVDPFCGFNFGSTVCRATPKKNEPAMKFVFESPVLRLSTDFGYADVFENGLDIMDGSWEGTIFPKSIVIYRYYEQASALLGTGETPGIEKFAKGLSQLILRVRELVCSNNGITEEDFRCYLVAHSMGGLVCRAFLQNPDLGHDDARRSVDKVFTYATPHNGIDMAGFNVRKWLSYADLNNFNREHMAEYLNLRELHKKTGRVDWLPENEKSFPPERFFCMVGTNRGDYEAAWGYSRTFAGHGSDGLVRIENASVWGVNDMDQRTPCATAYAYRSHSGYFGIVNSEEAYQNLTRFLFGDIRVDIWVDIKNVWLPSEIEGESVDALYQFELWASPRGKRWFLTRRVAEEDSVACCNHKELMVDLQNNRTRSMFLSTVFLAKSDGVELKNPSLVYGLTLGVRKPDYWIDRKPWLKTHIEGTYLFREEMIVTIVPPQQEGGNWTADHNSADFIWQSEEPRRGSERSSWSFADYKLMNGKLQMSVPFDSDRQPGIAGDLRFIISTWNDGTDSSKGDKPKPPKIPPMKNMENKATIGFRKGEMAN